MSEAFGLRAPIKAQLEAILQDYPAGQMLSEGLQNAEDAGASRFSLMLDLRQHEVADLQNQKLERCQGPAFILADNGGGFEDRNWASLQNLHQSEKRYSPCEIGRFGMGSRSYFHFADIVFVVSKGRYVALDPLEICSNSGGWCYRDLRQVCQVESLPFQIPEFNCNFSAGEFSGSMFRLPLRLAEHADDGLGPEISVQQARRLMSDWEKPLRDGRILLFLKNVSCIDMWIWENGAAAPVLVSRKERKQLNDAPSFERLPSTVPESARSSFKELEVFMANWTFDPSTISFVVVEILGDNCYSKWLLVEAFMCIEVLKRLMTSCLSIPTVGIAIQLDATQPISGAAFCFLPIGDLSTGFPVHVNATFQVHKNRRSLWLDEAEQGSTLGNVGKQEKWVEWNYALLREALPILWIAGLEEMKKMGCADILSAFPTDTEGPSEWRLCAVEFYRRLADQSVLPHDREGCVNWVAPSIATSIETLSSTGPLTQLRDDIIDVYRVSSGIPAKHLVVFLDAMVEKNCYNYSRLQRRSLESLIETILLPFADHAALAPVLVGMAAACGRGLVKLECQKWKRLLADVAWVRLKSGSLANLCDAFDSKAPHLPDFSVMQSATAVFDASKDVLEAALPILRDWGLKTLMTWQDIRDEAQEVEHAASVPGANRLLDYLYQNHSILAGGETEKVRIWKFLNALKIVPSLPPGSHPKETAHEEMDLLAPIDLFRQEDCDYVWASRHSASRPLPMKWLDYKSLEPSVLVDQIRALAKMQNPEVAARYIFRTLDKLIDSRATKNLQWLSILFTPLLSEAWVPCHVEFSNGAIKLQLFPPARVVQKWNYRLSPNFALISDDWKRRFSSEVLDALGIPSMAAAVDLAGDLQKLAQQQTVTLSSPQLILAIALANELGCVLEKAPSSQAVDPLCKIYVPTMSSKLVPTGSVYINDAKLPKGSIDIVSDRISPQCARLLGCTSARDELSRQCEEADEEFGQKEDIATRIRGLLHDYNSPSDLFTEHWQNCDDAGAEKIQFCLDMSSYGVSSLVDSRANVLQGPSLVLGSSKPLDGEDIKKIQRLGQSEKKRSFQTAGRFGVGLNCMYHFTDSPQLLANNALHIFDPLRATVATPNQQGRKFSCEKLEQSFPDMLTPFQDLPNGGEFPTVFRLPLRLKAQDGCFSDIVSPAGVKNILLAFALKSEECLIFSKSVREVRIVIKEADGIVTECARFSTQPSKCQRFLQSLPKRLEEVAQLCSGKNYLQTVGEVTTVGHVGGRVVDSHLWRVCHHLHANEAQLRWIRNEFNASRAAYIPHGAVALLVKGRPSYKGNLACYYPLSVEIGLPLLFHGCFSLPSSRKNVPLPKSRGITSVNDQQSWNASIITGPLVTCLLEILLACKPPVGSDLGSVKTWFALIELSDQDCNMSSKPFRDFLKPALLRMLVAEKRDVFPVVSHGKVATYDSREPFLSPQPSLEESVQSFLIDIGLHLRSVSKSLLEEMPDLPLFTARNLCIFLKSPAGLDGMVRCSAVVVLKLLEFFLDAQISFEFLRGVPLLLLQSGCLTIFGTRCHSAHRKLLPHSPDSFIHTSMLDLLKKKINDPKKLRLALEVVNITDVKLGDLQKERVAIHEKKLNEDQEWLETFWQFLCKILPKGFPLSPELNEWVVLQVASSTGNCRSVALSEMSLSFSCHETDNDWVQDICSILFSLGAHILHRKKNSSALELLKPFVHSGINGIFHLLRPSRASSLTVEQRAKLLSYFSTRKNLSRFDLNEIRGLEIFRLRVGSTFISIDKSSNHYVCIAPDSQLSDSDATQLITAADIPGVEHLAWPLEKFKVIYIDLGVELMRCDEFVLRHLVPFISARCGKELPADIWKVLRIFVCERCCNDVIKQLQSIPFVRTASGAWATPVNLVSSDLPISCAFLTSLESSLPDPSLKPYFDVLSKLGLRKALSFSEIILCAANFDEKVRGGNSSAQAMIEPSFLLVEAACSYLQKHWQSSRLATRQALDLRGHETMDTQRLCQFQIFAVNDNQISSGKFYDAMKCRARSDDKSHTIEDATVQFRAMSDGIVLPESATFASATHFISAHRDTKRDRLSNKRTNFQSLCEEFPKEMLHVFGIITKESDIPRVVLVDQLAALSSFPTSFSKSSLLYQDYQRLMNKIDFVLQVKDMDCSFADILNSVCGKKPCIAIEISSDAAGHFNDAIIRLCLPAHCFFNLPEGCMEVESRFRQCSTQYHVANTTLGVKKSPDLNDWAAYSTHIYESVHLNALVDDADHIANDRSPLDNESREIELSLSEIEKILESASVASNDPISLTLVDDKGLMTLSSSLVWPDNQSLHLQSRCTGLRFVDPALKIRDGIKLCSASTLETLSHRIREVQHKTCDAAPRKDGSDIYAGNAFEIAFESLFSNVYFANGLFRVLVQEDGMKDSQDEFDKIKTFLERLRFSWVPELRTELIDTSTGQAMDGSQAEELCFILESEDRISVLAVRGFVGDIGQKEDELLQSIARRLISCLQRNLSTSVKNMMLLFSMLKAWTDPAKIPNQLATFGIRTQPAEYSWRCYPGMIVPDEYLQYLRQDVFSIFYVNELAALRVEDEAGEPQYVYARVMKLPDAPKTSIAGATANIDLERKYNVMINLDGHTEFRTHKELFKESRGDRLLHTNVTATIGASDDVDGALHAEFDLIKLLSCLQQMQSMSLKEYKAMSRRLGLTWHPDKSLHPRANEVMAIINKHSECFHGDKDFAWVSAAIADPTGWSSSRATDAADYHPGDQRRERQQEKWPANSWQADINRERTKLAPRSGSRMESGFHPGAQPSGSSSWANENRVRDTEMSEVLWTTGLDDVDSAEIMEAAGKWAACAMYCQQAAEKMIKATMLRTCGITIDEMKGKGAHDLVALMDSVLDGAKSEAWPVRRDQLHRLSDAYLRSRYPPFPSTSDYSLPSSKFSSNDASESLEVANRIIAWGNDTEYLPTPRHRKKIRIVEEDVYDERIELSLEPASVPPPEVVLPPHLPPPPAQSLPRPCEDGKAVCVEIGFPSQLLPGTTMLRITDIEEE